MSLRIWSAHIVLVVSLGTLVDVPAAARECIKIPWSSQDLVETLSARLVSRFELFGTEPA